MSGKSMDVFSLRDAVVGEYKRFATSFTTIYADDIREQVEAIYAKERYWPEPLIQVNPSFKKTTTIDKLVADGVLDPRNAEIFRTEPAPPGRASNSTGTSTRRSRRPRRGRATSSRRAPAPASRSASSSPS